MTDTATRAISEHEAERYRAQFPIFDHTVYLNSCSLGPPSRDVLAALADYGADWSRFGAPAWMEAWIPRLSAARERFAGLIGAETREVTISHSISSALASVASTFDYTERNVVVCADLDFPTIPYQWLAKERLGVEVRFVHSPDRVRVPLEAYEQAMDEKVALIAASHVFFTSGHIQPIRELADLAHRRGARIVVDGYHAVGALPVDVRALDVDFYLGGTLKWLLGGPGLTFIYARGDLIPRLAPTVSGWFASAEQFAFDPRRLVWPDTADRLELGTPAVSTAYAGVVGMDMVRQAQPERIYARLQQLTGQVVERALDDGYQVVSPLEAEERAGIVMLRVREPQQTVQRLAERGFTVDYRPGLVRVSPHFFNTQDDVDSFMDALRDIQRGTATS